MQKEMRFATGVWFWSEGEGQDAEKKEKKKTHGGCLI